MEDINIDYYMKGTDDSSVLLGNRLQALIPSGTTQMIILCIGTTHIRGDSLGPLVGSRLASMKLPQLTIYGTEDDPVHALNLAKTLELIQIKHPDIPVLAVDASSGGLRSLGQITIGSGPLFPGSGLEKKLPPAGNIHITGILGLSGTFSFFSLKYTSIQRVQRLANVISKGILQGLASISS